MNYDSLAPSIIEMDLLEGILSSSSQTDFEENLIEGASSSLSPTEIEENLIDDDELIGLESVELNMEDRSISPFWWGRPINVLPMSFKFISGAFQNMPDELIGIKKDMEVTIQISEQPITGSVILLLQRDGDFKDVPIKNDTRDCRDTDETLVQWPFRVQAANSQVEYKMVNHEGMSEHCAAQINLVNNNVIKIIFTRIGTKNNVKEEREMITKSMSGRRWFLKALEPNDLTILDKSRIQVFSELRNPVKKCSQENGETKKRKNTQDDTENEPEPQEAVTKLLIVFYAIRGKIRTHTGFVYVDVTDPFDLSNVILENRDFFKKEALKNLVKHFGLPQSDDQIDLPNFDLTFTLKTISQLGTQVFQQEFWSGGPLEALMNPELVQPLTGQDGKKFHVIDCRVDISSI